MRNLILTSRKFSVIWKKVLWEYGIKKDYFVRHRCMGAEDWLRAKLSA